MKQDRNIKQKQFTRLLVENQRRLFGFIFSLVHDHSVSDDILQDVSTLLWDKFDSFEQGTDFGAWAMKVARFKVLEWRRKQQKLPLPIEEELLMDLAKKAEIAQQTTDLGRMEALEHCMSKLSEQDNALLKQRYTQDLSVSNIADDLGRTRDAVYKVLARIHRDLQLCVQKTLNDDMQGLL